MARTAPAVAKALNNKAAFPVANRQPATMTGTPREAASLSMDTESAVTSTASALKHRGVAHEQQRRNKENKKEMEGND